MAINPDLLIAAPMLQDYLVDKTTGFPLAAGIVTCYQDDSRTTLKNWYYQAGTPGAYTYVALANPLTLSAVGTITDPNGEDTIPFFYPFSELDDSTSQPYYITVDNSNLQRQFTRQNFPFIPNSSTTNITPTLRNYIENNVFWRNVGSANVSTPPNTVTINGATCYYSNLAPSQHDGFSMPDIIFLKNVTGATDNITFTQFGLNNDPLPSTITPEYYLNFKCSASTPSETLKCIQIPISLHIKTLESVQATLVISAQNVSGNTNNKLTASVFQFLGTGSSGTSAISPIGSGSITTSNSWDTYEITFTFPSGQGVTVSNTGDNALYLQIGFPLSVTCEINFTKPAIYLSTKVPTNDFDTYDQIDTIINSPRTGDVRTSVNSFQPFGWVAMNDGTIGNSSSNATTRANVDTWPLFNLLWNYAKTYDAGSGGHFNPICQMYSSAASTVDYGSSAYADWNANNQLALTKMLGRTVIGTVPISTLLSYGNQNITGSNGGGNLLITLGSGSNLGFYNGQPVTFTTTGSLPGNIVANAVYYVCNLGASTFNVATTFQNSITNTLVAYSSNGSSSKVVIDTMGAPIGEATHAITINELPAHDHPLAFAVNSTNAAAGSGVNATSVGSTTTGSTGGNGGMNNIQASNLYNIFMKL